MFKPDYKNIVDAARNIEPKRVPLYDHNVSDAIIEKVIGKKITHLLSQDLDEYYREYNNFFLQCGYDTVTYEACITEILPFGGALAHPQPGYIDTKEKFDSYPFDEAVEIFKDTFKPRFDALKAAMPQGMKAIGGVGNGVFEIAQDLAGYENLCIMSYEEPELYAKLFVKIGDMMQKIWTWFLDNYSDTYCVARFGDDLGYKSNTMLTHEDIRKHIIPQYQKIIGLVHGRNIPFLLHSCGCIFDVMDDLIQDAHIDAKHSNEDQIADFTVWVDRYGEKIGNFGGIDTDHLVRMPSDELVGLVRRLLGYCSKGHGGFAIGSGNSIPAYVNVDKYLLMIDTVRKYRGDY